MRVKSEGRAEFELEHLPDHAALAADGWDRRKRYLCSNEPVLRVLARRRAASRFWQLDTAKVFYRSDSLALASLMVMPAANHSQLPCL
ncbi:MAG: hypothetical protein EOR68_28900 [Mesorhizobium sp.]|uniref:hypothetical protein n=1 Tax=Mesorhizobium sp. TaxID=1871066 RepID=UPI000FEAA467|nr:hypothetical protein [Mesorhizobium sp.]RWL91651.1 MAG: hypothetical protein EOR68_28900 [Mesorhizobium sp.]TIP50145.1 MAG: hypothetical protein E5X77_07580 [Mesorhizobium sp.]TJV70220.1 MAG: hypothetical protein E5X76_21505 [Mesorhizobium sp.]